MNTNEQKNAVAGEKLADAKAACSPTTFDGTLVSLAGGNLVMKNTSGKEYSHTLAKDAKLTCDGSVCKAEEIKAGTRIRVTTAKDDRNSATRIESIAKNTEFATCG